MPGNAAPTCHRAVAAAALEALGRDGYDVLLSDISMPEEDAIPLIRKVRAVNPRIPAAAITAFAAPKNRDAALPRASSSTSPSPWSPRPSPAPLNLSPPRG